MSTVSMKEINRLAMPAIIAGVAEPVIALADTAIIGHLGAEELGGVGIASSFFLLIVWILAQTKSALSAIISRYYGMGKIKEVASLVPQAILLNVLIGFLFFLLTFPFVSGIFTFYEAKGDLLDFASQYFYIRSAGLPLTLATFAIFGVFRGLQNTSWAMQISIAGGVVNIVLDLLLVYGIQGIIPAMGVPGAAWGSLMAQACMLLLALFYLKRKTSFRLHFRLFPIHPELFQLGRMSTDLFIRTIALNLAYYLGVRFATSYGPEQVAAHTIAMNIWLFSAFFIDGYSNAGNAIAGRLAGEGNLKTLYKTGMLLTRINFLIGILLGLLYLGAYPWIGAMFSEDAIVINHLNSVFWLVIICQPINSLAFTFDGIYKGLGKTKFLRNLLISATVAGFVPMIFIGDRLEMGLYGIWAAFFMWMMFRSVPLILDFRKSYNLE